jgi:acetoin utilization deacetylase AcuC-like enzyme
VTSPAIFYDPEHRRHRPKIEILYGRPLTHPEQPDRVEGIRRALSGTRWEALVAGPKRYPLELAHLAHEPEYVEHLRARGAEADAEGLDGEWFPYVFPRDRSMDMGTPLQRETVEHAWASACVALSGADWVLAGAPWVYALCRPPGHHAAAGASGGYCYFNNAALAAMRLLDAASGAPGQPDKRVAILDLDIHHGNGTQDIFYSTNRVLYCSIHGDPEWAYPPHTGFAGEHGTDEGYGFTFNQPLPEGTGWDEYAGALDRALERISLYAPVFLVLSQGFDTFEGDRWGGFLLRAEHFAKIGDRVRSLGIPVVALLEGGYEPENLAFGSLALLEGLGSGRT